MRETFTSLQTTTKEYASIPSDNTDFDTFLKKELNKAYHEVLAYLRNWIVQDSAHTATTVADQQFYDYPPDMYAPVDAATVTIGGVAYTLTVIHSQQQWNAINEITFSGTVIPQFLFPRRDDFGTWPIPGASGNTITLVGRFLDRDMSIADFTTGTVTVTNNDATVAHSASGFTAAMVGRWFQTTDDQFWYRIASRTDADNIELSQAFQGTTAAGAAFTIGESPEIPPELHELLPHKAAAKYLMGQRGSSAKAQQHLNYYWTGDLNNTSRSRRDKFGGLLGAYNRYSSRDISGVIDKAGVDLSIGRDERWTTTLS
jgi:hypothetical protein